MTVEKAREIFYNHTGVRFNSSAPEKMAIVARLKLWDRWKEPQCSADLRKAVKTLTDAARQSAGPKHAVFAVAKPKPSPSLFPPSIPRRKP